MRLGIKNLGKIETADIEINAITVIAGENNTGKSTVGKILYCIFNSLYKIDEQIEAERNMAISRAIIMAYHNASGRLTRRFDPDELSKSILANKGLYINDEISLQKEIESHFVLNDQDFEKYVGKAKLDSVANNIIRILNTTNDEILITILRKRMLAEFRMQINNIYRSENICEITLKIKETEVKILIKDNDVIEISDNLSLNTEVIYIDNPYAMDDLSNPVIHTRYGYETHRVHLSMCLSDKEKAVSIKDAFDEIIVSRRLNKVFERLNSVCPGNMVWKSSHSFAYMENGPDAMVDIVNVSTGLKTFVIIKTLLLNGRIEENGTLILDEPEIHLHPEWQLILAELIVLLQKEFNLHILINTHSPYFLYAIEVYSRKHGISSKCKYYLAEASGTVSVITDVSDNIEKIYKKLARPLQVLENVRYSDD